jgi:hypothetical protein
MNVKNARLSTFFTTRKRVIAFASLTLLLFGVAANGAGNLNNLESGYLLCVNNKSKTVTHPGTAKCPRGSTSLVLGAKGNDGIPGLTGAAGLNVAEEMMEKHLWNGLKDPENYLGLHRAT